MRAPRLRDPIHAWQGITLSLMLGIVGFLEGWDLATPEAPMVPVTVPETVDWNDRALQPPSGMRFIEWSTDRHVMTEATGSADGMGRAPRFYAFADLQLESRLPRLPPPIGVFSAEAPGTTQSPWGPIRVDCGLPPEEGPDVLIVWIAFGERPGSLGYLGTRGDLDRFMAWSEDLVAPWGKPGLIGTRIRECVEAIEPRAAKS